MKKIKYIFVTLLIAILAISLIGCRTKSSTEINNDNSQAKIEVEVKEAEAVRMETFDEDITFEVTYVNDGEVMPYALLSPSFVNTYDPMPLIVWLHGMGEINASEKEFLKTGPASIIPEWKLTNFNAYILCPQLKGKYSASSWSNKGVVSNVSTLLDDFIANHNIDQEKIIVIGTSLGGQGAIYMSVKMSEYFDKAVVLNGYASDAHCSDIEIPVIGYIGTVEKGEDSKSINFMNRYFAGSVGEENLIVVDSSHGKLPQNVFNLDSDENGKSDVIEWMLSDT